MKIRMLRDLPGHIARLAEPMVTGRDYDVGDDIGETFCREGWAIKSPPPPPARPPRTTVEAE